MWIRTLPLTSQGQKTGFNLIIVLIPEQNEPEQQSIQNHLQLVPFLTKILVDSPIFFFFYTVKTCVNKIWQQKDYKMILAFMFLLKGYFHPTLPSNIFFKNKFQNSLPDYRRQIQFLIVPFKIFIIYDNTYKM